MLLLSEVCRRQPIDDCGAGGALVRFAAWVFGDAAGVLVRLGTCLRDPPTGVVPDPERRAAGGGALGRLWLDGCFCVGVPVEFLFGPGGGGVCLLDDEGAAYVFGAPLPVDVDVVDTCCIFFS